MEQKILNYNIGIRRDIREFYSYSYLEKIDAGQLVVVNFRNKEEIGIVIDDKPSKFSGKIKNILSILPYKLNQEYIDFAKFVASYNLTNIGNILKFLVPFSVNKILLPEKNIKSARIKEERAKLSVDQEEAVAKILKFQKSFKAILLHGITGSGKTEVFLEFARSIVKEGKQILIMVPEIALSSELSEKASLRLGVNCHIWHNSVSPAKKLSIWKKAIEGEQICVVGARSSLFVPFKNLGCVIIDEEHDHSYKQTESAIYNARDMGVYLGSLLNIPVILSSATPSVESYNNAINGKYEHVKLNSRYFKNSCLPKIHIDDIRNRQLNGTLSEYSIGEIGACLASKKQVLIFVNRRGHTPKVLCKSCGWRVTCPGCSSWLCYHFERDEFVCHYCGHKTETKTKCENCEEISLIGVGSGVEKVSIDCSKIFPNARILALSSDLINTPNKILKAFELIKNQKVDLIIGTQIISKGHNFNNINLAVITCADSMLYGEDFRSVERAFQTIYQVSGRAGRIDGDSSKVIIQTYNPEDKIMRLIEKNDIDALYSMELENRKLTQTPPFGKIISLTLSGFSEKEVYAFGKKLALSAPKENDVKILGPIQPSLYKLRSRYRIKIHIFAQRNIQNYVKLWLNSLKIPGGISMSIDVDPYDFT